MRSSREAGEANKKNEKPLLAKFVPSNLGHTMEDLTARKNWGDMDVGSTLESSGQLRGEFDTSQWMATLQLLPLTRGKRNFQGVSA
jgi:hypothetical protein